MRSIGEFLCCAFFFSFTRMLTQHVAKLGYIGICMFLGTTHDFSSEIPLKLPSSCIISSLASRPLQTLWAASPLPTLLTKHPFVSSPNSVPHSTGRHAHSLSHANASTYILTIPILSNLCPLGYPFFKLCF